MEQCIYAYRKIFNCRWRESARPLLYYCKSMSISHRPGVNCRLCLFRAQRPYRCDRSLAGSLDGSVDARRSFTGWRLRENKKKHKIATDLRYSGTATCLTGVCRWSRPCCWWLDCITPNIDVKRFIVFVPVTFYVLKVFLFCQRFLVKKPVHWKFHQDVRAREALLKP